MASGRATSVRLRPQPHGFEGFGVVQEVALADHPAVLQCRDARVRLAQRNTARLSAHRHVCEQHQPVAQADEFRRLQADIGAPNLIRTLYVGAVPRRSVETWLRKSCLDELPVGVLLQIRLEADRHRIQIAAVVGLHREPDGSRQGRLAKTRPGWKFADQARGRSGQPREAQRKPLIERPPRPLAHPERLAHNLIARHRRPRARGSRAGPARVAALGALPLVPRQATFARLTTSRSTRSCACRLRQAM